MHQEATPHVHYALKAVRDAGCLAGLAICPGTPAATVLEVAHDIDLLLCMTVNPGWGGQSFIEHSIQKLERLKRLLPQEVAIEVDGGIDADTGPALRGGGRKRLRGGLGRVRSTRPGGRIRTDREEREWLTKSTSRCCWRSEERFAPPPEFVAQANFSDPAVYDEAEADFEGWWERWARELDWFEPWETVLEWNPPWAKWFKEGKLNASHNCLDRHVEAGSGDKVAYHWVGEDGTKRDVTYADLLDMTKRFANVMKSLGVGKGDVVGIYMPMIPETPAAMLACARIGATHNVVFGGFSVEAVKERMEVSDAKLLVTANATLRRGKPIPMKEQVDRVLGELPKIEHVVVVKRTDADTPMKEGRDLWWHEAIEKADADCPAEPLDAEHPLYILYTSGSTAKPKGILHTTGGYLTGVAATHQRGLRPEARHRRLLVRGRHRLGHRPLLHRLRAALQRRDVGDVRGRARLPGQGPLVADRRGLRRDDPLHRADRDPGVHQVGPRVPGQARPLVAAPARVGRRADQPARVDLVPPGDRRRALPDRRHVVADGDRPDHDHAAARASPRPSPAPRRGRSRASRPPW